MAEQLKACPFCGGGAAKSDYVRDGRRVHCPECGGAAGPRYHGPNNDTEERARAAWNMRVEARAEAAERLLREAVNGWEYLMDAYGTPRTAPARGRVAYIRAHLEGTDG